MLNFIVQKCLQFKIVQKLNIAIEHELDIIKIDNLNKMQQYW